jgi:branched-chain amino acid transport system permease protein
MLSFADTLAILPQQLVFGLTLGTAYGLIAIGYTMVYGVLFMINFAHGDIFMIGAYVGWALLGVLFASHIVPMNPMIVLPTLLIGAMVVTGVLGLLLERLAYRPLYQRGATRLGPLISAIGASIFLQNAVMLIAGAREKVYMTYAIFPRTWRFNLAGINVSVLVIVIACISLAMMLGLNWLVQRTWLGRAIRAVAEDREMAAVMGIDVWRVVALTFCIGSALGGAAGAMLGGLILGIVESLAITFINPAFKDAIAFVVLILVLMFRPGGILGEALPDWKRV